jgi:acetyl esterase/lipase
MRDPALSSVRYAILGLKSFSRYWIQGGGYVMGEIEQDDRLVKQLVKRIGCMAVSVDYRLAPEHPFTASVEDCYAGLKWLFAHGGKAIQG